jgi:hypothetical protein
MHTNPVAAAVVTRVTILKVVNDIEMGARSRGSCGRTLGSGTLGSGTLSGGALSGGALSSGALSGRTLSGGTLSGGALSGGTLRSGRAALVKPNRHNINANAFIATSKSLAL